MKKAIVTGGAGFIGPHLTRALMEEGWEVHVVDDLSLGKKENVPEGATLHECNVDDTKQLATLCEGVDTIFHLAAIPRVPYSIEYPLETNQANVTGTLSVLVAARNAGVRRVVFSSSSSIYGNQEAMPLSEDMVPQPLSPYAVQKRVGELYMSLFTELYDVEAVSLRYFNVYGSGMDPNGAYALVIGKFIQQRLDGEALTVTGDGEQTRDFTHISDVVRANMLASSSEHVGKGEVMNIGRGEEVSVKRIAELIGGEITHIEPRIEPKRSLANTERAEELLGWKPQVSIEEGIAELKKEFKI